MQNNKKAASYITSVLQNKCPRCRQGNLYVSNNAFNFKKEAYIQMHKYCGVCGQATEIEVGFYYGTGYVSYALTVAFSVSTFIAWWVLIGFSINDNRIFWWLGCNAALMIVLQTIFMRLSRSIWLSWFVKYDKNWIVHAPINTGRE
jgi:phage FluMu protein Com